MDLSIAFIFSAFFAGVLTFLAPCTLPIIPAYLAFISGVPRNELDSLENKKELSRKIFLNGIFFVLGFSVIFVIFGTLAGLVGGLLAPFRIWLARIGGIFIIIFGIFILSGGRLPFLSRLAVERRIKIPSWLILGKPSSSFIIGATFAFGWTPCVGPILGSIIFLASTTSTAITGALMLAVFSLGLALPFVLLAGLYSKTTEFINRHLKYLKLISIVGGIFLILLGALIATDNFGLTIQYGYKIFDFINYDALIDYL